MQHQESTRTCGENQVKAQSLVGEAQRHPLDDYRAQGPSIPCPSILAHTSRETLLEEKRTPWPTLGPGILCLLFQRCSGPQDPICGKECQGGQSRCVGEGNIQALGPKPDTGLEARLSKVRLDSGGKVGPVEVLAAAACPQQGQDTCSGLRARAVARSGRSRQVQAGELYFLGCQKTTRVSEPPGLTLGTPVRGARKVMILPGGCTARHSLWVCSEGALRDCGGEVH